MSKEKDNQIKLSEIADFMRRVYAGGYGQTIYIIVNGEYYDLINDDTTEGGDREPCRKN